MTAKFTLVRARVLVLIDIDPCLQSLNGRSNLARNGDLGSFLLVLLVWLHNMCLSAVSHQFDRCAKAVMTSRFTVVGVASRN